MIRDEQIKQALQSHKPVMVAGLTFTDIGGPVRVELPEDRHIDTVLLVPDEAEKLCVWLTFRFSGVREYIQRLQRGKSPVHLDPRAEEFLTGPTLGERMKLAVHTIRQNGPSRRNGDVAWLAVQLGVASMAVSRWFRDLAVPEPGLAVKIARVLGWPQDHMACLIQAARIRQIINKKKGEAA